MKVSASKHNGKQTQRDLHIVTCNSTIPSLYILLTRCCSLKYQNFILIICVSKVLISGTSDNSNKKRFPRICFTVSYSLHLDLSNSLPSFVSLGGLRKRHSTVDSISQSWTRSLHVIRLNTTIQTCD